MINPGTIFLFVLFLILMGFFAGIEMAFYGANRLAIELRRKQGGTKGKLLGQFIDSPVRFLGSTLVGFNLFLVFFSLQISDVMRPIWNFSHVGSNFIRLFAEIAISTFIVLIFAELIPRAIFRARSNILLDRLALVIDFCYQIYYPIAMGLINISEWVLKYVFNIRVDENKQALGAGNLETLFQQSKDDYDEKNDLNTELFENALELPKIKIRQSLVPRKEIVGVDIKSSVADLKNKFIETKLSRLLIFDNNIDHILGYVHQLDLFKNPSTIESVLLPIPAVPESMNVTDLINKFTKERKSIAWVVDEFGGTAGIITMEDLLEEIFGEIQDEYDTEEFVEKQLSENEYIFSGRLEVDYLNEKYNFEFPVTESETLSGYIINYHETIPRQKERIIIDDYEFDIISVTDTRIEMVKLKILK